jgi:hypothetical protein
LDSIARLAQEEHGEQIRRTDREEAERVQRVMEHEAEHHRLEAAVVAAAKATISNVWRREPQTLCCMGTLDGLNVHVRRLEAWERSAERIADARLAHGGTAAAGDAYTRRQHEIEDHQYRGRS